MKIQPTIKKSVRVSNFEFSTRQDYIEYFIENGILDSEEQLWKNKEFVSTIHRHWHGEGQNGCIFALLSARGADKRGWTDFVVTEMVDDIDNNLLSLIEKKILSSIKDPKCQILSLLFSNITTTRDLIKLIKKLLSIEIIQLENESIFDDWITLALRVPLNTENVLSWLMAFGPFDYFPKTRQSPIIEIAIRVKEKPIDLFYRLNNDRETAHLADLPLDYEDKVMERIWNNTLKRTRTILSEEPNHFSAAKTTFTIPREEWVQ